MWKNIVQPDRPKKWRMPIACWITKATNTHSDYEIIIAFSLQQLLHERASMSRCTYINSLVLIMIQNKFSFLHKIIITERVDITVRSQVVPHTCTLKLQTASLRAKVCMRRLLYGMADGSVLRVSIRKIILFGTGFLYLIQIYNQPDAKIFQFIILMFVYSSTCFGRFPAHHQEFNNCSGSLWFYLRIVVIVVLCSWSGPTTNTARLSPR
jgi:hypothetical protein